MVVRFFGVALGGLALAWTACGNGETGSSSGPAAGATSAASSGVGVGGAGAGGASAGGNGGGPVTVGTGGNGTTSATTGGGGGSVGGSGGAPDGGNFSDGASEDASGSAGSDGGAVTAIGSGPELSPVLVGQNYWGESDTEALFSVVKASGVKLIRFGGAGADNEQPSNDRYAAVATGIRGIGAEPYLQISRHFDATRAKQIVDFVNNQKALHVTYWSINNESDIGANEPMMSVADTANLIKTLGSAMKEADPTIRIFAPEVAFYDEAYLGPMLGGASDITGKDTNGRYYVDGITFHTYPFGATYTRDQVAAAAAGLRGSVGRLLTAMTAANQKNGRTGSNALGWALTEFNITYQNPADNSVDGLGVNSFLNGQFFAEVFGVGMANGAVTMDPWSIHESNGNRGASDLGYLDGPVASAKPRSSYQHLAMIAQYFKGRYAPATSTQALLRAIAAGDGKQVSVLLANESLDQAYDFGIRLDNGKLVQQRTVTVQVDAALAAEFDGTIAAESSMLLVFDPTGKLVKRIEYAIADARGALPPRDTTP
jgi:hypothetical protein